jgi:hypothetical protein
MKFVLTSNYQYWWPIKVRVPHEDARKAGQFREFQFMAQFQAMPIDEANALQAEIEALDPEAQGARQHDALKQVLIGWNDDVVGDDNEPIPFTPDNVQLVLSNIWALQALYLGWGASLTGGAARKGN